jgi:hypothetical protein
MTRVLLAPFVPHFHARRKDIHRGVWRDVTDVQDPRPGVNRWPGRPPGPGFPPVTPRAPGRTHPVHTRWAHGGGGDYG